MWPGPRPFPGSGAGRYIRNRLPNDESGRSAGRHVVYPEVEADRCTAALILDVDPIGLVRGRRNAAAPIEQYIMDRPYVPSSFLSVAITCALTAGWPQLSLE